MIKIIKQLYYKEYESPVFWGYKLEHKVKSYVKIELHLNFKQGLWFIAQAPNVSYSSRNLFKAIFRLLEHESIGMSKYNSLKERVRDTGLHKKL